MFYGWPHDLQTLLDTRKQKDGNNPPFLGHFIPSLISWMSESSSRFMLKLILNPLSKSPQVELNLTMTGHKSTTPFSLISWSIFKVHSTSDLYVSYPLNPHLMHVSSIHKKFVTKMYLHRCSVCYICPAQIMHVLCDFKWTRWFYKYVKLVNKSVIWL